MAPKQKFSEPKGFNKIVRQHYKLVHSSEYCYGNGMKKRIKIPESENGYEPTPPNSIPVREEDLHFPIVGIGASAGGLEALEQFLRNVTAECGIAFIIVQHLYPTHAGIMPELLQRITPMEVFQVSDRMKVKPDCIYVIPPNRDMSILHGVLHLFEQTATRGLRLPIDFFFHSLADDRAEGSIGVILSGMGSDGTLGLKAIKEKGGVALVQEPASARFDSMPRSVINAGLADIIAPVEELPGKIIAYLRYNIVIATPEPLLEEKDQSALDKVLILLRARTGNDFSLYKKNTIYRRIERRMSVHQIDRIALYVRYLQENHQEVQLLFKELLIGVSSFFRDPEVWVQVREVAIPAILASHPGGGCIRAWSAGCSTGEEAYSLAISFKEALETVKPGGHFTLQIFATDLNQDGIDFARRALYPAKVASDVTSEQLQRFFVKEGAGYRVGKEIREMVTFATQNAIMDAPFTKLDILICRNLLIYLTPELQNRLMPLFHYSLNPGGVLFLGSAESIGTLANHFEPLSIKSRLFRKRESLLSAELPSFPVLIAPQKPGFAKEITMMKPAVNLQTLADQLLLQHFSPPAVLTNDKGDVLYINGRTGKYLEPAAGKANWNIFAMIREELRFELGSAFQKALRQKGPVTVKGIKREMDDATRRVVDITVQAIQDPEALRGMIMIIFSEVAQQAEMRPSSSSQNAATDNASTIELKLELLQTREALQSTREEMHSSQEELTSTNEELQSTNEELQSTNEELTTSREEMQSLNEELQTVNAEQQFKMNEFSRVNDDMRNLLNSTEIVTIFLDNKLHVRRFTTGADKIFKLIASDVGRPLSDIVTDLVYPKMAEESQNVLHTLVFSEKQIAAADGRWFSVRIMPYRTTQDVISGVVITFANITAAKKLEAELREENAKLAALLEGRE